MCSAVGGTLLLRLEDIDQARCTAELERQMLEDLSWLGIKWSETPRRQSRHFSAYSQALDQLRREGLVYPAFLSRGEIRSMVAEKTRNGIEWPCDPDGAPHYPGFERDWPQARQTAMREQQPLHAWRLNMREVGKRVGEPLNWQETGKNGDGKPSPVRAHPELWGDVVLARSDTPTSYHLAVTLDDAEQEITHVVRGRDLYHSTAIHRLLQHLLNLPAPVYHHHDLVLDEDGRKLSKSKGAGVGGH